MASISGEVSSCPCVGTCGIRWLTDTSRNFWPNVVSSRTPLHLALGAGLCTGPEQTLPAAPEICEGKLAHRRAGATRLRSRYRRHGRERWDNSIDQAFFCGVNRDEFARRAIQSLTFGRQQQIALPVLAQRNERYFLLVLGGLLNHVSSQYGTKPIIHIFTRRSR